MNDMFGVNFSERTCVVSSREISAVVVYAAPFAVDWFELMLCWHTHVDAEDQREKGNKTVVEKLTI